MAKNKRNKRRGNKRGRNKALPSQVDLMIGAPSALAVAAFQRSGAGVHADKRRSRKRKNAWKDEIHRDSSSQDF